MQWLGPDPPVLLDVAHNAEGALRLVAALRMLNVRPSVRWVVGMVQGKDHEAFLRTLVRAGRNVHLASPRNERSVSTRVLERAADAAGARRAVHGSVADAVTSALASLAPDEILVVTGSFFTMEEACEVLGVEPRRSLYDAMEAVP
jgi:dihydrofolate synthase/folylpolyglutamate synthase